jgi:hypothetical protein
MLILATPLARAVFAATLVVFGAFLFFPLFWMLSTSFKPEAEIFVRMPTLLPSAPTLANYANALTRGDLLLYLRNSLLTATGGALLTVILGMYAAYGFAKFRYRGRTALMYLMLSAQMFPFAVLLISIYPLLQSVGLLDTRTGLVIAYIVLALPSGTYMLYSYFVSIPSEIIEAARADGAGDFISPHRAAACGAGLVTSGSVHVGVERPAVRAHAGRRPTSARSDRAVLASGRNAQRLGRGHGGVDPELAAVVIVSASCNAFHPGPPAGAVKS